jgi:acylphosphatase
MFTRDIAKKMGLTGWVRNRTNGDVEIVAEGDRKDLNLFLRYLWKGPRSSVVTNVETKWGPYTGEFSEFVIAPSAY